MMMANPIICVLAVAALGFITLASAAYQFKVQPTMEKVQEHTTAAVKRAKLSGDNKWKYIPGTKRYFLCNVNSRVAQEMQKHISTLKASIAYIVNKGKSQPSEFSNNLNAILKDIWNDVMGEFETTKGDCQKKENANDAGCIMLFRRIVAATYKAACSKIETDDAAETPALPQEEKELMDKVIETGEVKE